MEKSEIQIKVDQLNLFSNNLKINGIYPYLIYTNELSDVAKSFANALGVRTLKIPMLKYYPCIKCNINQSTGEKIYHLPFDQQYDNTKINIQKGNLWASTVLEAEEKGFRRAWKWKQNSNT
ncbi:hypothetical protein BH23BAC2_BH23BAC2_18110 [soil metagenome]